MFCKTFWFLLHWPNTDAPYDLKYPICFKIFRTTISISWYLEPWKKLFSFQLPKFMKQVTSQFFGTTVMLSSSIMYNGLIGLYTDSNLVNSRLKELSEFLDKTNKYQYPNVSVSTESLSLIRTLLIANIFLLYSMKDLLAISLLPQFTIYYIR